MDEDSKARMDVFLLRGREACHDTGITRWNRCEVYGAARGADDIDEPSGIFVCSLTEGHEGHHVAWPGHHPLRDACDIVRWADDPPREKKEHIMPVTPYLYTMIEIVYIDDAKNHDKFYRGFLDHQTFEVFYNYGRNGFWNQGQSTDPASFASLDAANKAMMNKIQAKLRKGYTVQRSLTVTCAKKPDLSVLVKEVNQPLYQLTEARFASSLVIANI